MNCTFLFNLHLHICELYSQNIAQKVDFLSVKIQSVHWMDNL